VAEAVVDPLEAVEVAEEDADRPAGAPAQAERVAQAVVQERAVGQAGELVLDGQALQLGVGRVQAARAPAQLEVAAVWRASARSASSARSSTVRGAVSQTQTEPSAWPSAVTIDAPA
jgi:hypothetical protein